MNDNYFIHTQPNPKDGKKSKKIDCVVRAICIAECISWVDAFDTLVSIARQDYDMPNSIPVCEKALKAKGYDIQSLKPQKGQKRMTAKEFALTHQNGTYILRLAHHLSAVVDGKIRDTWDCAVSCIYKVYTKN